MGLILAWLAGEGMLFYRWGRLGAPPTPGAVAASSGVFAGLAVLSAYPPARTAATLAAWGFDLAIFLQVVGKVPSGVTGWPPPDMDFPATMVFPPGRQSEGGNKGSSGA